MSARGDKPLSIAEANRLARGAVRVSADPVDASLWRVEDDEATEAHEPMTASEWLAFLKNWAS